MESHQFSIQGWGCDDYAVDSLTNCHEPVGTQHAEHHATHLYPANAPRPDWNTVRLEVTHTGTKGYFNDVLLLDLQPRELSSMTTGYLRIYGATNVGPNPPEVRNMRIEEYEDQPLANSTRLTPPVEVQCTATQTRVDVH